MKKNKLLKFSISVKNGTLNVVILFFDCITMKLIIQMPCSKYICCSIGSISCQLCRIRVQLNTWHIFSLPSITVKFE